MSFFKLSLAAGLAGAILAGCPTTGVGVVPVSPVTGIIVRAESLLAGVGCGTRATEVFKYAVLVVDADGQQVGFGVYDCFTDATFTNLIAPDSGRLDFVVRVSAMNEASYDAQTATIAAAPRDPSTFAAIAPTWSTACTATQQSNIEVLAVCLPLTRSDAPGTMVLGTAAFPGADGGTLACGTDFTSVRVRWPAGDMPPVDGGTLDGGADGSGDAQAPATPPVTPPGGSTDAGAGDVVLACPDSVTVDPSEPGTRYSFDVELFDAQGQAVGSTVCSAVAAPGVTASAQCAAVRPVP